MFKKCIIDADSMIFVYGCVIQKTDKETGDIEVEPVHHAFYLLNKKIESCIKLSQTNSIEIYLAGGNTKDNFRFSIYKYYKEGRYKCIEKCGNPHPYDCNEQEGHKLESSKPYYYKEIKEYLMERWGAIEAIKEEADDIVSIRNNELNEGIFHKEKKECIIWHIDKDLNNNPGWHGNYNTGEIYYISEIEALRNFYLQILTGDVSDSIPRIKYRWLKKKTEEKMNKAQTEEELLEITREAIYNIRQEQFKEDFKEMELMQLMEEELTMRGRLVWMRREKGQLWSPPTMSWAMKMTLNGSIK